MSTDNNPDSRGLPAINVTSPGSSISSSDVEQRQKRVFGREKSIGQPRSDKFSYEHTLTRMEVGVLPEGQKIKRNTSTVVPVKTQSYYSPG